MVAAPPAPDTSWLALDAGVLAGVFVPQSTGAAATNLGHPTTPGDAVGDGGSFAAHVGYFPIPRAGLEAQFALMPAGHAAESGTATIASERLSSRSAPSRIGTSGSACCSVRTSSRSTHATDGGIHYGAAFTVALAHDLTLRLEALHLITVRA